MSPNRYEVLGKIADGGLGSVYKAYDRNLRREVALKRVRAESPEQAEQQAEQLLTEARTLSSLQHPHIVTIYDVGRDEEGAYIIMELLKGETLENIIERGALNEVDFRELVSQSLEGMIAAHATGLIHLDIKPQNFMVIWLPSGKFQIKILDFGLSKIAHAPAVQEMDDDGAIMGSIFFMAPEQFERTPVDVRTDLYSLGCVYYHALTQHYPFQGETGQEVMASHLYHSLVPLSELRPDLPAFIHQWVEWLMSRLPENRPADAAAAYEYFKHGYFNAIETAEHAVAEAHAHAATGTGPLRLTGKRPTRPVPVVRTPGSASQPLGHRPNAPRPMVKPINIAAAMAPKHLTAPRKPIPKAVTLGIPALVVVVAVIILLLQKRKEDIREGRLQSLYLQDHPTGTSMDVEMLVSMLAEPERSETAGKVLGKLQGVDTEDDVLVRQLPKAGSVMAQKNLVNAIGARGIRDADSGLIDVLGTAKDKDLRKATWQALQNCAQGGDLSEMLSKLGDADLDEIPPAEKAITAAMLREHNVDRRSGPLVKAYKANSGSDDLQTALLRMMGRAHGPTALTELVKALKGNNLKLRLAAAAALGEWPNGDPLTDLLGVLANEKAVVLRMEIYKSIAKLALLSSDVPQKQIADALIKAYQSIKDKAQQSAVLNTLGSVADPASEEFLKGLSNREPEAHDKLALVSAALKHLLPIADTGALDVEHAIMSRGPYVRDGIIMNIKLPDRVGWLIQVDKAAQYEVLLTQGSTSSSPGRFVLGIGPEQFERQVTVTGKNNFQSISLGRARFSEAGIYRVTLRVVDLAPDDQLMLLKQMDLKKVEN